MKTTVQISLVYLIQINGVQLTVIQDSNFTRIENIGIIKATNYYQQSTQQIINKLMDNHFLIANSSINQCYTNIKQYNSQDTRLYLVYLNTLTLEISNS